MCGSHPCCDRLSGADLRRPIPSIGSTLISPSDMGRKRHSTVRSLQPNGSEPRGVSVSNRLPRLLLSKESVLPGHTWARFPGGVSGSTGRASSIRTSLDRAHDVTDGPPGSCSPGHEWPILPVPWSTFRSERKTPTLIRGSALNLL